jgi:hypothetical protein
MTAERPYPGAPRFPKLAAIAMVEGRIERADKIATERVILHLFTRPLRRSLC